MINNQQPVSLDSKITQLNESKTDNEALTTNNNRQVFFPLYTLFEKLKLINVSI